MPPVFETSDANGSQHQRPIRVATRKDYIFSSAKEMVADLPGWVLERSDDDGLVLHCTKKGGVLGGTSAITVTIEGPDETPSATVNCRCETTGGLLARPKAVVEEFMRLFYRRVC